MSNKITTTFISILVVAFVSVFFLWRYTANSLTTTRDQLCNAQETIKSLKSDNNNLIEYITQKDNKIKELEQKYTESLENIPADQCGDAKPSKELLTYFKKAYNK